MDFIVRAATVADAPAVSQLAQDFAAYLRDLGDMTDFQLDEAAVRRDGFGPNPAFAGLVAEQDGRLIGYLLYHDGYDTDLAIRLLHVVDLYVHQDARLQGVGQTLMLAAAHICRQRGGKALVWTVYKPNRLAAAFYEGLGAEYLRDLEIMYWPLPAQLSEQPGPQNPPPPSRPTPAAGT
ncbi:MAG: GNAT family N-acetyltransferase [Chloroflexi bacterium]|nr:GNAT family N-acetyltransferase [Chloroflexota bacterium]